MNAKGMPAALAAAGLLLQACGGGGDDTLGGTTPPPPPDTSAYTALLPYVTAAGALVLRDPANPATAPSPVDTGLDAPSVSLLTSPFGALGPIRLLDGTYEAATHLLRDRHYSRVVYIKNGRLYRVSLLPAESQAPAQVSSRTDICRFRGVHSSFTGDADAAIRVVVPGTDGDCGTNADNQVVWFPLSAGTTTQGTPIDATFTNRATLWTASGTVAGRLGLVSGAQTKLVRLDASFANSQDVLVLSSGSDAFVGPTHSRTVVYLQMRPSGQSQHRLYRYDAAGPSLTQIHVFGSGVTLASSISVLGAADDAYFYFADGNVIHRVAHASTSLQTLHTAPSGIAFLTLDATSARLVAHEADSGSGLQRMVSLPKSGATTLTELEPATLNALTYYDVAGDRVHYTVEDGSGTPIAVSVLADGSSPVRRTGADWLGLTLATTSGLGGANAHQQVSTLLLGITNNALTALYPVAGATGVQGASLGSVQNALRGYGDNYGRYLLTNVEVDRLDGTADFDAYFADVGAADSLRAVAQTAGADDAAVR